MKSHPESVHPSRTLRLRVTIQMPEGSRISAIPPHCNTEEQHLARLLSEHLTHGYLPSITAGGHPIGLAVATTRTEGGQS